MDAQRLESVGVLAGGIANDLNIFLTPILMSAALLDEEISDPASRRVLSILSDAAQRGAEMVQQIVEFARLTERPESAVTNPRGLLEDLRRLLAETYPRAIDLAIEVRADGPNINVDQGKVRLVLSILCANAHDAMPAGGLLTLRAGAAEIDAATAARTSDAHPGKFVVLTVMDNGSGIPTAIRDRVFEPFFTTKGDNRGLGLTTAREIVLAEGGFMTIDSQPERGTSVNVFLPACAAPPVTAVIRPDTSTLRGRGELILIVEDESSLRLMMSEVLAGSGYRVLTAANGAEAVAKFGRHPGKVAAVVTDLMMPLMDGAFTVRALRTMDPAAKLIAITSARDDAPEREGPGFAAVLPKPFRVDALLRILRNVLDE